MPSVPELRTAMKPEGFRKFRRHLAEIPGTRKDGKKSEALALRFEGYGQKQKEDAAFGATNVF